MTLAEYLAETKTSATAFAAAIGVTPAAAHRYVRHERIPRPEVMARIVQATQRKVSPSDFYSQPEQAA